MVSKLLCSLNSKWMPTIILSEIRVGKYWLCPTSVPNNCIHKDTQEATTYDLILII